ncbi:MAG: hypothetical protein ACOCRK_09560 [bacterium]
MSYIKWSIITLVSISIVVLILYKPFYKTEVKKITVNNSIDNITIYKNKTIYLFKSEKNNVILFIDRNKKEIYKPNYNYINLNKIILWRRDMLDGVPLSSAAKVYEQEVIWKEDAVMFTYGKDSSREYYIVW